MRSLAALGALSVLVLGAAPQALALSKTPASFGHAVPPHGKTSRAVLLSALETDIVARMNAQRGARGLRPFRVSRGLTAAANYHCREMGLFGFFEHDSRNGA